MLLRLAPFVYRAIERGERFGTFPQVRGFSGRSSPATDTMDMRERRSVMTGMIGLYRDWPVSKGCTPPYVPVWVEAMLKRQGK